MGSTGWSGAMERSDSDDSAECPNYSPSDSEEEDRDEFGGPRRFGGGGGGSGIGGEHSDEPEVASSRFATAMDFVIVSLDALKSVKVAYNLLSAMNHNLSRSSFMGTFAGEMGKILPSIIGDNIRGLTEYVNPKWTSAETPEELIAFANDDDILLTSSRRRSTTVLSSPIVTITKVPISSLDPECFKASIGPLGFEEFNDAGIDCTVVDGACTTADGPLAGRQLCGCAAAAKRSSPVRQPINRS